MADPHAGTPPCDVHSASDDAPASLAADETTQARSAVTLGLYVSATRCLLQYVVAPALGAFGALAGGLGVLLQVLGAITSVSGAVRLRRLGWRWWPAYAVVALGVALVTVVVLIRAVAR